MPLSQEDIQEELSYAYIHAISSRMGFGCDRPGKDRDKVDVTIQAYGFLEPNSEITSPELKIQLKATSRPVERDDHFIFSIDISTYHNLRQETHHVPKILVLFIMPENSDEWLEHDEDALITRKCAYWVSLKGMPDTQNTTTISIQVPKANILSPENLHSILLRISRLEEL